MTSVFLFCSGQGQVHDRPHFSGRTLAEVPRSLGEHLEQHAHRCRQRGERGDQQG
jgi:hypothetical protein